MHRGHDPLILLQKPKTSKYEFGSGSTRSLLRSLMGREGKQLNDRSSDVGVIT